MDDLVLFEKLFGLMINGFYDYRLCLESNFKYICFINFYLDIEKVLKEKIIDILLLNIKLYGRVFLN